MNTQVTFLSMMFMVSMLVVQMNAPREIMTETAEWLPGKGYTIEFWWTPDMVSILVCAEGDRLFPCSKRCVHGKKFRFYGSEIGTNHSDSYAARIALLEAFEFIYENPQYEFEHSLEVLKNHGTDAFDDGCTIYDDRECELGTVSWYVPMICIEEDLNGQ